MAKIEEALENQDCDVDCRNTRFEYSRSHLMTVHKSLSINKNHFFELWLASRLGGFHFAYKNNDWVANDGKRFWDSLTEAVAAHGETVTF